MPDIPGAAMHILTTPEEMRAFDASAAGRFGIESADEQVLASMQKKQNLRRNILEDLHDIYGHGIGVNGGSTRSR